MPSAFLPPIYASLASAITAWAHAHNDIRAMVLVGSYARADGTADDGSDLDLIVFVTDPVIFAADPSWLDRFGQIVAARLIDGNHGTPEWLVLYADGTKVDLMFVAADGDLCQMLMTFPYQVVLRRGMEVLLDKTPTCGELLPDEPIRQPPAPPTAAEYAQALYSALLIADKAARLLQRGDLWRAKMLTDADLKPHLLAMLAWHAQAHADHDTWYDGRYLETWADSEALRDLPATFAAYSLEDVRRALAATLTLYRRLAEATAAKWGYAFPGASFSFVARRIAGN